MAPHHSPLRRLLPAVSAAAASVLVATLGLTLLAPAAHARPAIDDYAAYEPQTKCSPTVKPAMEYLARWAVARFGGEYGGISRACGGSKSEHKEGRAFDWTMDADEPSDQRRVQRFLKKVLRTDRQGNEHALARRMGIMYIIWDDQMYASYDRFAAKPYRHSACKSVARCSKTLRHRDHVHISLSRAGGAAETSWYARELKRVLRARAEQAAREAKASPPSPPSPPSGPSPQRRQCSRVPPRPSRPCRAAGASRPTPSASRRSGRRHGPRARCRSPRDGSGVRCASAPGCAPTSRRCGRR